MVLLTKKGEFVAHTSHTTPENRVILQATTFGAKVPSITGRCLRAEEGGGRQSNVCILAKFWFRAKE